MAPLQFLLFIYYNFLCQTNMDQGQGEPMEITRNDNSIHKLLNISKHKEILSFYKSS